MTLLPFVEDGQSRGSSMEMLVLGVGTVLVYLLAAVVYYKYTLRKIVPERLDRGLLAFTPALYVIKKVMTRLGWPSAGRGQGDNGPGGHLDR